MEQKQRKLPDDLTLGAGAHNPNEPNGEFLACIMEAVAYLAGEPWSDHPECASPLIASACRSLNDGIKDTAWRTELLASLVPKIIGTRDDRELERSYLALDWIVRVYVPAWMSLVPELESRAAELRALPPIRSLSDFGKVPQESLAVSAGDARAAGAAARAAAWDAAWAAAWDAAGDAAWAAAGDAAWAAAGAAARAAAGAAAWDAAWAAAGAAARAAAGDAAWAAAGAAAGAAAWAAAGDAARAAAWDAAWDAAWAAAWAAAGAAAGDAARAAAWAAARAKLAPTVKELQESFVQVLMAMCELRKSGQDD